MSFLNLFLLQVIAHLLADYTFQTKAMASSKSKLGFKSSKLKWHIGIVLIFSILLSLDWKFIPFAVGLAATHWIIDGCKPLLLHSRLSKYSFFIDQFLHLIIIFFTVYFYINYNQWDPVIPNLNPEILYIIAAFIFCTKPANIVIREIFDVYDIFLKEMRKISPMPVG